MTDPQFDLPAFDPTEEPAQELRVERVFAAPRAAVWRAFTDPDQFARWFGPVGFGVPRESVVVEPRAGGRHAYRMRQDGDDGEGHAVWGSFTEVEDERLLVAELLADGFPGADGPTPTWLRIELHDDPAGTRLVLTQGPYTLFMNEMAARGWRSSFTKLDSVLAVAA